VGFANLISSMAQGENATWPLFRIPDFELHAGQIRLQTGAEVIGCTILVDSKDGDDYLNYVTNNYEDSLREGHMTLYGNLDRLTAIGYKPNFTIVGPTGFVPDTMDRSFRAPTWQLSPRTYK
jgi:hypothetical protein